jgi:putative permease
VFFAIPLATLVKAVFNAWPRRAQQALSLQPPLDLTIENNEMPPST